MMMFIAGHIHRHKCHQKRSGHCPLTFKSVVNTLTGDPRGNKDSEATHVNDGSTPLSIFTFTYFAEIVILLVVKTNRYYHWCFVSFQNGSSSQNYGTEAEMFVFLAVTKQNGHCLPDQLTDNWAKLDQFYTPFHINMMRQKDNLHTLWFLHFMDNRNGVDRMEDNYDRLWKIWDVFEI